MKLMLIIGSVREDRKADIISNWVLGTLKQDPELEIDVADLKDVPLPFYNEPVTPEAAHDKYKNPDGNAWAKRVGKAEAFLIITPEYNYGTSAVLKNAIDWVYYGWNKKVAGFISYGGISAGTRALGQLRQNIQNVKLFSTSTNVSIPFVGKSFDEKGKPLNPHMDENLKNMITELKDLTSRLKS